MYNYCTLFDSNYLTRGLAMYQSLKAHSSDFHLYIFTFDDRSYSTLSKLGLKFITLIGLNEFEDEDLLKVKIDRSPTEYCWTCTPAIIKYCIEKYQLSHCTYLDADLYFFEDPSPLVEEMGSQSVLLTEHRYTPQYDQSSTSGIYCVQFMTFRNDANGMKVLNWWRLACIDWCYARFEDGKFGDQKYLDDWPEKFDGVHVLQNPGGGIAPWNVQQYNWHSEETRLIFYHFHGLRFLKGDRVEFGSYRLRKADVQSIYIPYLRHIERINTQIKKYDSTYDYNGTINSKSLKSCLNNLKRIVNRNFNLYDKRKLLGLKNGL